MACSVVMGHSPKESLIPESLTASIPTPEMYRADPEYLHELQRRYEMMSGGKKFPVESLLKERGSNKYYTGSSGPPPLPPRRDD